MLKNTSKCYWTQIDLTAKNSLFNQPTKAVAGQITLSTIALSQKLII